MRRRGAPITCALAAAAAAIALAVAGLAAGGDVPDPAENGPETWTFDAHQKTMPAAELNHFRHASIKGDRIPCVRCHHTSKGTDVEAGCGDCHGAATADGVPDIKSASHSLCIRCHLQHDAKVASRPAPYRCDGCHKGALPAK
jgi:predicted CXXCH cytochrome family protein